MRASHTRRTRNNLNVVSCSASFPRHTTCTEHETTPLLVFFRVRHLFFTLQHTKRHQRLCWCRFVFCRGRNHTLVGVISYSARFLHPTTHAEHRNTPRWCDFVFGVFSSPSYTGRDGTSAGTGAGLPKKPHGTSLRPKGPHLGFWRLALYSLALAL
jgi:hypothetical protein